MQLILIGLIRVYRWVLSPAKSIIFGPLGRCRFSPSCSAYALEALGRHGAMHGSWLALRRVCRCHPWGGCGHDPVPPVQTEAEPRVTGWPFWAGAGANARDRARHIKEFISSGKA